MENQVIIPDDIDFAESDLAEMGKQRVLAPTGKKGRIRFRIIDASTSVSAEKGTMQIVLKAAPLKDPDDADSVQPGLAVRHGLTLPITNRDFPGHKAPNTAGLCGNYYRAVNVDVPQYPRWDKDAKAFTFNGEEIDKDDVDSKKRESNLALAAQLKEDWRAPANRLDDSFYAEVVHNAQGFVNIKSESAELPDDCELVPFDQWTAEGPAASTEAPAKEEKPAPKGGAKPSKPASKPETKKPATKNKKK